MRNGNTHNNRVSRVAIPFLMNCTRIAGCSVAAIAGLLLGCSTHLNTPTNSNEAAPSLEAFQERNLHIDIISNNDAGYIDYFAGGNIAPDCIVHAAENDDYHRYAECVIEHLAPFVVGRSRNKLARPIHVRLSEKGLDGYHHLIVDQLFYNHPVIDHEINITLDSRKQLVEFSGQILDVQKIQHVANHSYFETMEEAFRWSQEHLGVDVLFVRRFFDPEFEAVMIEVADRKEEHLRYVVNERTRRLHETINHVSNNHQMTLQRVNHTIHDNGIGERVDPVLNNSWREYQIKVRLSGSGESCEYSLDHGSNHDQGEPKVGVKFYGTYRPDGSTTYRRDGNCTDEDVMLFAPEFFVSQAANAYFWIHDLAVFAQQPQAAYNAQYPWKNYDPENLRVIVSNDNQCPPTAAACAKPGTTEYKLYLSDAKGSTTDLATMAHEYGHILHFQ